MKGRKLFIMEEDKNIADSIFKERRNEIHIQLEETESLINQCDEKNAIAYISKSELEELCSLLEKDELTLQIMLKRNASSATAERLFHF